jgi:RecA/RadA recombinase
MAKRKTKKKEDGPMSLDDGFNKLLELAEKDAKRKSDFYRATDEMETWRYVDFIDLGKDRPCLPLEWLHGTRGFLCGRVVKYDSNEQAGKSSIILMNVGMAQRTTGVWSSLWETEKTVPPPDYIYSLGCDPKYLLIAKPDTVDACVNEMVDFVKTVRLGIDPDKNHPIIVGVDSVSGLGADDLETDEKDKKSKAGLGFHAREFSKFFREKFKLFDRDDVILFATAQVKASIETGSLPGMGGGGKKTASLADKPFAYHASWRIKLYHTRLKDSDGRDLGEMITMYTEKNKLGPKGRSVKVLLRNKTDVPDGQPVWDFTQANIDLLFGPNCPFEPDEYKSAGGWYSHTALNDGKSMHKEDFVNKFYENEELLMRCREKLRIRGFGFKFETDYERLETDDGTEKQTAADAG